MDYQHAKYALEKMIMPRWPVWNPNEVQKADWIATLSGFDWNEARSAVFEYVQNSELFTCPKLNVMVKLLRKHADIMRKRDEKNRTIQKYTHYLTIDQKLMIKQRILEGPDTPAKKFLAAMK